MFTVIFFDVWHDENVGVWQIIVKSDWREKSLLNKMIEQSNTKKKMILG